MEELVGVIYIARHGFEDLAQFLAADELLVLGVEVDEALGAHELALAVDVHLVVWHPLALDAGPGLDFLGPLFHGCWVDELVFIDTQEEIAIFVVRGHLFFGERTHIERSDVSEANWTWEREGWAK